MYVLTKKSDNEVVIISDKFQIVSNGVLLNDGNSDIIFCGPLMDSLNTLTVEQIPEGISSNKYCYTVAAGFYLNPNYVEFKTPEQKMADLQAENATLKSNQETIQAALDDFFMNVLPTIKPM